MLINYPCNNATPNFTESNQNLLIVSIQCYLLSAAVLFQAGLQDNLKHSNYDVGDLSGRYFV